MGIEIAEGGSTATDFQPQANASTRFYVKIDGIERAVFSEVSGLQMETELFEYMEGGNNEYVHRLPGITKAGNVTLKRGITSGNELLKWYTNVSSGLLDLKTVTITVYKTSVNRAPVLRIELLHAFPCKWSGLQLVAGTDALAVESVEFAHMGILAFTFPES